MPAHVDYSYGKTLGSLRNSDGVVSIRCGEMLIDQMSYERTVDGRALELDGRLFREQFRDARGHQQPVRGPAIGRHVPRRWV
jgi:hypothetical protein